MHVGRARGSVCSHGGIGYLGAAAARNKGSGGHNFTVGARKTWTESLVGGSRVVPLASRFSETVILLYFILHSNTCGGCAIGARACVLVRLWETSACPLGVPLVGDSLGSAASPPQLKCPTVCERASHFLSGRTKGSGKDLRMKIQRFMVSGAFVEVCALWSGSLYF